jgi:prepilin-type N-terminal cleavage/methylation domain-containing protein
VRANVDGFSLVELLVALTIAVIVTAAALMVVAPSSANVLTRSETADMQQRLRVAADAVSQELANAAAGSYADGINAPLVNNIAPIVPARFGGTGADPPGTFKHDTITIYSAPRAGGPPTGTTFWLKADDATATYQLMRNITTNSLDVPVVDHVVSLAFDYYGDPQPPTMRRPLDDPIGPWTTYGPKPASVPVAPFAARENCTFVDDGSETPKPRLETLGAVGGTLVPLGAPRLTDGPWCPSDADQNRWDADLLRIRSVVVTIRVEAASPLVRGPASALFAHGGTSRSGERWVPDQEVRLEISPRNMNLGR